MKKPLTAWHGGAISTLVCALVYAGCTMGGLHLKVNSNTFGNADLSVTGASWGHPSAPGLTNSLPVTNAPLVTP